MASANGSAVDLSAKSRIDVSDDEPEDTSEGVLLLCLVHAGSLQKFFCLTLQWPVRTAARCI